MSKVNLTEVRKAIANEMIAGYVGKGITNAVVVLPALDEDGVIQDTAVTLSGTKGWGTVNVVSFTASYNVATGIMSTTNRWTLIRGNGATLELNYKPGQNIGGRIITMETTVPTNALNVKQDMKYFNTNMYNSVAAGATDVPACKIGGKPIYRVNRWSPDTNATDILIPHDNNEEIQAWIAKNTVSMNKPNSDALKNASPANGGRGTRAAR